MAKPPTANLDQGTDSGDRLSFTLFLAIALHGLLILGVSFHYSAEPNIPPTFEVTLATHQSREAPEEADFQAQFDQQASGTENEAKELTTDKMAPFADTRVQQVTPPPEKKATQASEAQQLDRVETTDSHLQVAKVKDTEDMQAQREKQGRDVEIPLVSPEIASLRAKLARQQQAYAQKPRIRRLTSVATKSSAEAAYLNRWRERIETVGNKNFPEQALNQRIFGQLRLAARLKANGTIVDVELLESSGHTILDNAAMQIVHMAAPFEPFPAEITQNTDQLEIIRTWRFEITGLSTN